MKPSPFVVLLGFCLIASCDPVQTARVDALGSEAVGVRKGPLHRPGQPCTYCHDGALGNPSAFSVAGTLYPTPSAPVGLAGATVTMTDAVGSKYASTTNEAGNFYVEPSRWSPTFPIVANVVTFGGQSVTMYSKIGVSTACASCHSTVEGPSSPGRIVLQLDDGGAPP
ncbi:hypothetical protein BH09MYX1_BH09MYX1_44630 [soil metagenome]